MKNSDFDAPDAKILFVIFVSFVILSLWLQSSVNKCDCDRNQPIKEEINNV